MSVLRLSFMYLRLLPLQPWVMLAGLVLLVVGMLVSGLNGAKVFLAGAFLMVFFPALFGGVALRVASDGCGLRLRPAGHRKMLLGALLSTVLLTVLHAVPVIIAVRWHWIAPLHGLTQPLESAPGAVKYLLGAWSVISIAWLLMFWMLLRPLRVMASALVLPFALILADRYVDTRNVPPEMLFLVPVAGWIAFAVWYLRAPRLPNLATSVQVVALSQDKPSLLDGGAEGRAVALRAYLTGATSWRTDLMSFGSSMASLVPLVAIVMLNRKGMPLLSIVGALMLTMPGGALAVIVKRRARYLWLKAGVDRAGLFLATERATTRGSAIAVAIYATVLVLVIAFLQPGSITTMVLFCLVFTAFGLAVMYAALCLVRPWKVVYLIPLAVGLTAWCGLVFALLPEKGRGPLWYFTATGALLVLAALLRAAARQRWRHLDWQLLRPAFLSRGARMQVRG